MAKKQLSLALRAHGAGDKVAPTMLSVRDNLPWLGVLQSPKDGGSWGVSGMARNGRSAARIGATIFLALVFTGCTLVRTNVEVFHDLPADYAGQQIAIVPAEPSQANTIEFMTYASKLAAKLAEVGFQVAPPDPDQPPDYIAALAYGVGAQQAGAAYTSGSVTSNHAGGARYSGTTTVESRYPRALVVGIYSVPKHEGTQPQQVYSMTALSTGRCRALSSVIDPILDAAFRDFPGESGKSRTVTNPKSGISC